MIEAYSENSEDRMHVIKAGDSYKISNYGRYEKGQYGCKS